MSTDFGTPVAERAIDAALVRRLISEQCPQFAGHDVQPFESGWDNAIFRIGSTHLARMPRREMAVPFARNEHLCLPALAAHLPTPVPVPVFVGTATAAYPWPWSIVPWLEGTPAAGQPLNPQGAMQLARFWATLHSLPAETLPGDITPSTVRGVPLGNRRESFEDRLPRLAALGEPLSPSLQAVWANALAAPRSSAGVIIQGDPHARNVLTRNGELAAVLDWGDITVGDAACDLASFWMLVHDTATRDEAVDLYHRRAGHADALADFDALITRAKGWALLYGALLRVTGLVDNPVHAEMGGLTLRNIDQSL